MTQLFFDWLSNDLLFVPDSLVFIFVAVASLFILNFLLDFIRFIIYYITRR